MRADQVYSISSAFAYLTDCTLATVASMAMKKSRPKGEYNRQIAIAQKACDLMKVFAIDPRGTRAYDIIGKMSVNDWAYQFDALKEDE